MVDRQSGQVLASVRNLTTGNGKPDSRVSMAALQDHWWVERQDGDRWVAMDVLPPDARIGKTLVAAADVSDWNSADDAPSIPDSEWHSVQIRIVVEKYDDGAATESTVLEARLRPAEVFDRPVKLIHLPEPWPENLPDAATDPNALGNAAANVRMWVPLLEVGDSVVVQSGFTESGELKANPLGAQQDVSEVGGGSLFGGFDDALSGSAGATSYLTAEWLDYEVRGPGQQTRPLRRPVFDVLGPARRAARTPGFDATTNDLLIQRYEALLSDIHILLQPCGFTDAFVAHLALTGVVENQAALRELSQEHDLAKARSSASKLLKRLNAWGALPDLVLWRSALGASPADVFVDRTNVLNYRLIPAVVSADQAASRELIDVAANAVAVRDLMAGSAVETRIRQGVADTLAEVLALGGEPGAAENTASIFATAGTADSLSIGPRDTTTLDALDWPADVASRLAEHVNAGFIAVIPRQAVQIGGRDRLGWWRIDPATGETIGVMDTGFHVALSEKELLEKATKEANEMERMGASAYWARQEAMRNAAFAEIMIIWCLIALASSIQ